MTKPKTQSDKFKQTAREHGADEDEKHWEERLMKVAKHKQAPDSPEHKEVGDETLNPGPDHPSKSDSKGGGDEGRV